MGETKTQIHSSMLKMAAKCGAQFQYRYGARFGIWDKEEIRPPTFALAIGTAVHKSIEDNLKTKIETGELLPRDKVTAIARDSFQGTMADGLYLSDNEADDIIRVTGENIDMTVRLAGLHYDEVAPDLNPNEVEKKIVVVLKDYPYDLAGQIDIVQDGEIGDVKTIAKTPGPDAYISLQMGMYAIMYRAWKKSLPRNVFIDHLVKLKTVKAFRSEGPPEPWWVDRVFNRVEQFTEAIEAVKAGRKALTPADPESWVCTRKYCGWHNRCPFWSGR